MNRTVFPALAAAILLSPLAATAQPPAPARPQTTAQVFDKMCRNCHGSDGKAETKMGRKHEVDSFAEVEWQKRHSDAEIRDAILNGVPDTKMKAYRSKLSKEQVDSLVAHVRNFDPRRSSGSATGGGQPPAPAKGAGSNQQPPAPAKGAGSNQQPPAPAKGGGSNQQPPAPAKGVGSNQQPPAPAKGAGSNQQPPAPATTSGTNQQPPAPARN